MILARNAWLIIVKNVQARKIFAINAKIVIFYKMKPFVT